MGIGYVLLLEPRTPKVFVYSQDSEVWRSAGAGFVTLI